MLGHLFLGAVANTTIKFKTFVDIALANIAKQSNLNVFGMQLNTMNCKIS